MTKSVPIVLILFYLVNMSLVQSFVKSYGNRISIMRFSRTSTLRNFLVPRMLDHSLNRNVLFPFSTRLMASKKVATVDDATKPKSKAKAKKVKVSELNESDARAELLLLNHEINHHDLLYYDKSTPEISDAAYDKLIRRATDIVGRFPSLQSSVVKLDKVGFAVNGNSKFAPFNHTKPMQSLDNAFTESDLESFLSKVGKGLSNPGRTEFMMEPKIDGLSLSLHYVKGELVRAGTRGDGSVGEDVTVNVRQHIHSIPQHIETQLPFVEVRGEVYISKSDFMQVNEERKAANQSVFSTARNAASGSLRRLDTTSNTSSTDRRLKFFAYSLLQGVSSNNVSEGDLESQSAALKALEDLGFTVASPHVVISLDLYSGGASLLYERCKQLESGSPQWDFDADGVVLKVNHFPLQQLLGEGTKAPKWAIAFKFSGDVATTTLEDILFQVGRTGVVTPVARLTPTLIGGVTVERATLHNFNEVRRLSLFKGARVLLKRSGDVIPKILGLAPEGSRSRSSTERSSSDSNEGSNSCSAAGGDGASCIDLDDVYCREFELPQHCPGCGSPLVSDANGTMRCSGGPRVCAAQAVEQISHFCSRDAADIQGLGTAKLEYLYKNGYIKSILDLYRLRDADVNSGGKNESRASLRGQKGWGDRSVNNLLASIDQSRSSLTMTRLLFGLGINQLGLQMAKDISEQFNNDFRSFWTYVRTAVARGGGRGAGLESPSLDRLTSIHGFGPVVLAAVLDFAKNDESVALVESLLSELSFSSANNAKKSHDTATEGVVSPLSGRKVVFTGAFESGLTRKQAQDMCIELGGSCHNSVVKSVDLLVDCSSPNEAKSEKRLKAEKLGIEVWSEQQWNDAVKSK